MNTVYLIGDKDRFGYYKIGVTRGNVNKRLKNLQTGNSGELYVENTYETENGFFIEKVLHNRLSHKQTLNEWFELDLEDVTNFKKTCQSIETILESTKENHFIKKKYSKD